MATANDPQVLICLFIVYVNCLTHNQAMSGVSTTEWRTTGCQAGRQWAPYGLWCDLGVSGRTLCHQTTELVELVGKAVAVAPGLLKF